EAMVQMGEPKYRGLAVFRWIYQRGVMDPEQMTDLPKSLRTKLAEEGLKDPLTISREHKSDDTTRKLLLRLHDDKEIESVLIPQRIQGDADVVTLDEEDREEERTSGLALF